MGNANGREDGGNASDDLSGMSNGDPAAHQSYAPTSNAPSRVFSSDLMANTPPASPGCSRSSLLFAPQVPLSPLLRADGPGFPNQNKQNESPGESHPSEEVIPMIITWSFGGNDVAVEGSWDSWTSRKVLQRSGKDHSILLVLPSGIYHYRFIVDGEWRYVPDLPHIADDHGRICNILDVHDNVPESTESIAEFEAPASPDSSYGQALPSEEDFAKEPILVPPQLHVTVLGAENPEEAASSRPQHVVLNHVFIEKGRAPQSVVALGLTHRFQSKYVTVVLYKPLNR
ncbi:hypothetical protein SAY86_031818 [Trapa natans]|uniref:Association with the SNF1 complex (ASC) domain-containing protein n=1 Tax=Trapa natans TaxID=22666 RepID=A0AAN7R7V6_TRANT|nr:hypothetical protein SAY86_031818 [Trapa natans]